MLGAITIQRLLMKMKETDASDLHIKVGSPPVLRLASKLHVVDAPQLNDDDTRQLLRGIIPKHLEPDLEERGGIDFSHHETIDGESNRFRCSVFHAGGALHAAIRRVNPIVPDFAELHLPPIYEQVSDSSHEGLVIICGVTGSGKSSTLAAMIDHINERRHANIITIEDPVEYAFRPKMSYISQREIGIDVPNFEAGLRAAVRQDPDILMIGELRDRETMLAGIQAAETGHLVFVTLHTADTMQAFTRILEFFDSKDHPFIRSSLAAGLKSVMAQRLLPSIRTGTSRIPATEVLVNTPTVADAIREGEDENLPAIMAGSEREGMHDFTHSLARLVAEDWVDLKTALRFAPNADALRSRVRGIEVRADTLVGKVRG